MFISLLVAALPLLSYAAPLRRSSPADAQVLNFANVLEQLETQFYSTALAKFQESDFTSAGFNSAQVPIEQFKNILKDETAHQKFINGTIPAIGGKIVKGCSFNFDAALTDVTTMIETARVVENVGVSAYLGAAHILKDPQVLEAAGSIVTTEARHQTILNVMAGGATAIPSPFDIPLAPNEVLAIAGGFISGCDLGIQANKPLKITNSAVNTGTLLTFSADNMPSDTSSLHCHMLVGGAINTISLPLNQCNVPATVNGPVAIWVSADAQPIAGNVVLRNTATSTIAGPAMAFIDATSESLGGLVRTGSSSSGSSNSSSSGSSNSSSSGSSNSGSNSTSIPPSGRPNLTTGDGPDGSLTVNGWTNIPPSDS